MSLSCVGDVPELCGGSHGCPGAMWGFTWMSLSCVGFICMSLSCVGVHIDVPGLCGGSHGCP